MSLPRRPISLFARLCRVCKVSPSGFYAWAARLAAGPGPAAVARQIAAGHIARVHAASRRRYGSPRVTAQLAREGIADNHKAVEREMARQGLAGRCSRRKIRTTWRNPGQTPAADLVHRDFTRPGTDELWIGDATYILLLRAGRSCRRTALKLVDFGLTSFCSCPRVEHAVEVIEAFPKIGALKVKHLHARNGSALIVVYDDHIAVPVMEPGSADGGLGADALIVQQAGDEILALSCPGLEAKQGTQTVATHPTRALRAYLD